MALIYIIVKDIGHLYKYNRLKQSTSTFKKYVLSSSAARALSASNLTQTSISSQLDNKDITTYQNRNNNSNKYDIHLCIKTQEQNYSAQATSATPTLAPLNTTLPIAPVELQKTNQ